MGPHVRKTKGINDQKLADLGRAYRLARADLVVAGEYADELRDAVLTELETRGVDVVEADGLRIERRERVVRKVDLLRLPEVIGRSLFARLTRPALNTGKWNAAVESGLVEPKQLAEVETSSSSAPWVEVHDTDQS